MSESTQATLASEYVKEQERCRQLVRVYDSLPDGAGWFARSMIMLLLRRADRAAMEQDTVAMIGLLREMQQCE